MDYDDEFKTVDIILDSDAQTRGVDAFALSLIKCERQIRRLVTHLVFQYPCFDREDVPTLIATLGENRKVYFEGFIRGFDAIYPQAIQLLIGQDYGRLRTRLEEAINHRNKIFHGQLTRSGLTRDDLFRYVADIRAWCSSLAVATLEEIGYDGFARDSFQKAEIDDLCQRYKIQITDVDGYQAFIRQYVQRQP